MARIKRDVRKADRERLRQNMRKNGHTHIDQISAAMRHHWQYGYLESYRRTVEYTQMKICDEINARLGLNYGDPESIDLTTYSIYERWPYRGACSASSVPHGSGARNWRSRPGTRSRTS